MTNLDLISAIGGAADEDLEQSEVRRCGKRRRLLPKLLIAAAVAALLSTTVFAVPAIRNALFGVQTTQSFISGIFLEENRPADVREGSMDVSLDVNLDPAAPAVLERCYVPMLPATQWEPIPLEINQGASLVFEQGSLLQWKNEAGDYVLFRQDASPDYHGDYAWDSVCTGFDAACSVTQEELAGYTVQRIVVEPSSAEREWVRGEHPGLQKLYWSDGFYIFSMEVNYSMSDAQLRAILESIQPVEDAAAYARVREIPTQITPEPGLRLEQILYPTSLPEGFTASVGVRQPNGEYLFLWDRPAPDGSLCVLELSNGPEGRNHDARMIWETHYIPQRTEERELNGMEVLCYENGFRSQLLWSFEGVDYTLRCSGLNRLSYEELWEILEGLELREDIDSLLLD